MRPLQPPVPCTLALIEHRNKPDEPALEIVRKALLELREGGVTSRADRRTRGMGRVEEAAERLFDARHISHVHKVGAGTCKFGHKPALVGAVNVRSGMLEETWTDSTLTSFALRP